MASCIAGTRSGVRLPAGGCAGCRSTAQCTAGTAHRTCVGRRSWPRRQAGPGSERHNSGRLHNTHGMLTVVRFRTAHEGCSALTCRQKRWKQPSRNASSRGVSLRQMAQDIKACRQGKVIAWWKWKWKWGSRRKALQGNFGISGTVVRHFSPSSSPSRGRRAIALLGSFSLGRTAMWLKVRCTWGDCVPCGKCIRTRGKDERGAARRVGHFQERLRTGEGPGEE